MSSDIASFDENATLIVHIPRRRARILLVCVVVLNGSPAKVDNIAQVGLCWVPGVPNLDLQNICVREPSSTQGLGKVRTVVVSTVFIAHQKLLFSTEEDFPPGDKVVWQVTSAQIALQLTEDCDHVVRLDMFSSIDSKTGKPDGKQIGEIVGDPLSDIVLFCVEINQTGQPTCIEVNRIVPRIERSFAVKIGWTVGNCRKLLAWRLVCILSVGVNETLGVERRHTVSIVQGATVFVRPCGAGAAVAVAVVRVGVVSRANHVVHNSVGIHSHS
mmetsp:Transcript_15346/g.30161  ORF Transcript_15346/g.30161 Transcript_15346/m.30161 type:complete len:272 (+) Transcript_15346:457-1272(+)